MVRGFYAQRKKSLPCFNIASIEYPKCRKNIWWHGVAPYYGHEPHAHTPLTYPPLHRPRKLRNRQSEFTTHYARQRIVRAMQGDGA